MRIPILSLSGIHMRLSYCSTLLFSLYSPHAIFPSRVVPFAFFFRISSTSLSAELSVRISFRSSLSIWRLMVSIVLAWSTPETWGVSGVGPAMESLSTWGASKASSGSRIWLWFCRCFISPSQGESSDSLERMSGLPDSFPGRYLIVKS